MGRAIRFLIFIGVIIGVIVVVLAKNKETLEAKVEKPVIIDKAPVKTAVAVKKRLAEHLTLLGSVIPQNDIMVMSETQGRIIEVKKEKGDRVNKGEAIVIVDKELKDANLSTVQVNLEKAKKDLARLEDLLKQNVGTETQVEGARLQVKNLEAQLIVAQRQVNDTRIVAPIGGVLNDRMVNLGGMVAPGTPIGNIVDLSMLKLNVNVPELDVFKLKLGDKVEIVADVYPGATIAGTVKMISSKGDQAHNYPVEIQIANDSRYPLKAGMFCRANFLSIPQRETVVIPREALVGGTQDAKVYVVENGVAVLKSITIGGERDGQIEAISGLEENQEVIVSGLINLHDGSKIEILK